MNDQEKAEVFQRIIGEFDQTDENNLVWAMPLTIRRLPNALYVVETDEGRVLAHQSAETIIKGLQAFYQRITPEEIAVINESYMPQPDLPAPDDTPGAIYVMHFNDRYKIGFSRSGVHKRRYKIQGELRKRHLEGKLSIVYTKHTLHPAWLERQLHSLFDAKRIEFEWFNLSDSDLAELRAFAEQQS